MEKISCNAADQIKAFLSNRWGSHFVCRSTVLVDAAETDEPFCFLPGSSGVSLSASALVRIEIPDPERAILRPTFPMEILAPSLHRLALELDRHICSMFLHAANGVQVRNRKEPAWVWLNRVESHVWSWCYEQMGEIDSCLVLDYESYAALREAMIHDFGLYEPTLAAEESVRTFLTFHGMNILRSHAMNLGESVGWDGPGLAYTRTAMVSRMRLTPPSELPEEIVDLPRTVLQSDNGGMIVELYFQEENLPDRLTVYAAVGHDVICPDPRQLVPVSYFGRRE